MTQEPEILDQESHGIPLSSIDVNARKVLNRLHEAGYRACLVGGGVRDLMLGITPKDFDVATDATPEEVKRLFRNARLIGRRFRLAHVRYGREIIEVATFRAPHEEAIEDAEALIEHTGRILRDNVYGSLEQDVWRRDFTINSLYYDIADGSVIDYTGGVGDLREGVLRMIGDSHQRYHEDPVRMLRAVRFAAKLAFHIDPDAENIIRDLAHLLGGAPPARLFEEFLKLMHGGAAFETFRLLREYDLFSQLFPETEQALQGSGGESFQKFIENALQNTDKRVREGKPVNPAFLIAVMLWKPVTDAQQVHLDNGLPPLVSLQKASQEVISREVRHVAVPRRFSTQSREIWELQRRLQRTNGKRPYRLLKEGRFRAGYDFLCLRAHSGEEDLLALCDWWTKFQEENPVARPAAAPSSQRRRQPARRKPRRRKPAKPAE
ncbi:MAG TPA: polynucleotide adenylyltransferase PcnB [Gammaproteobacteria bacterium]|nr:polynucleotide adenylyltransferase PcnB [Gammaproteobacteria bacterium]